ncbi:hypothetical protein ANO11243_068540 [Dothideomycetidae sp. 11243]|nr:hypothetical protein ANO11243_068540 [fungal sp. No.11243]
MIACQIVFTFHFAFQAVTWHYGNGEHIQDLQIGNAEQAYKVGNGRRGYSLVHWTDLYCQYWFLAGIFYIWGTALVKITIGLLLLHFITQRYQRLVVFSVNIICIALGIAYSLLLIFDCKPISYWWNLDPNAKGTCLAAMTFLIIGYVIAGVNAVADCAFAIIPMLIMRDTTMDRRSRYAVCGILGIGSIACIATIVRVPFGRAFNGYRGDFLYRTSPIAILSTLELGLGIVCANAATFRPLFQHLFPSSDSASQPPTLTTMTSNDLPRPSDVENRGRGSIALSETKRHHHHHKFSRVNHKGVSSLSGCEDIADIPDLLFLQTSHQSRSGD